MDVHEWDDFEILYWYLEGGKTKYKTLIIDTASQLQQLCIQKVNQNERAGDWGTMTKREWGQVAAQMKTWIINLRNLPMDVVIIAQDRVFNTGEDDDSGGMIDPEVGPGLSPSVARHLNAAVHVIGNTFIRNRVITKKVKLTGKKKGTKTKTIEKIEYCLRIGPNPVYVTKVRKPKAIEAPSVIVDPTYEDIIALVTGEANG